MGTSAAARRRDDDNATLAVRTGRDGSQGRDDSAGCDLHGVPLVGSGAPRLTGGPGQALALQRAVGNRAVSRMLGSTAVQRHGDGPGLAGAATATSGSAPAGTRASAPTSSAPAAASAAARMAGTPAAAVGPLGAAVAAAWTTALRTFNTMSALRVVWDAMVARGEINPGLVTPAALDPAFANSAIVNNVRLSVVRTGGTVGAANLGCRPDPSAPAGAPKPMVAINVPENLVNGLFIGDDPARIRAAMITVHSALRHEHRHVEQFAAACGSGETTTGRCHYCNDPDEMDAYLSEIESGRNLPNTDRANAPAHRAELRRAWVRVFVHWEYLAPEQQAVFAARKQAAQAVIDTFHPNVAWAAEAEVATYRREKCDPHGTVDDQRGQCSAPIARSQSVRPDAPPPVTPERQHLIDLARFLGQSATFYRPGTQVDDARLRRTLEGWQRSLLGARSMVDRTAADRDMLLELRRAYRAAVAAIIAAAAAHLRQPVATVRRRHFTRIDPWGQ